MKAITIWQPWASLLACGAKQFETRSWATSYRGPLAIHAANKPLSQVAPLMSNRAWQATLDLLASRYGVCTDADNWLDLPCGVIIATAELVGCHEIVRHGGRGMPADGPGWLETDHGIYEPSDQELLFGDWTPGRYAWEIANVKLLDTPIPARGKQRLWNWEAVQAGEGGKNA